MSDREISDMPLESDLMYDLVRRLTVRSPRSGAAVSVTGSGPMSLGTLLEGVTYGFQIITNAGSASSLGHYNVVGVTASSSDCPLSSGREDYVTGLGQTASIIKDAVVTGSFTCYVYSLNSGSLTY